MPICPYVFPNRASSTWTTSLPPVEAQCVQPLLGNPANALSAPQLRRRHFFGIVSRCHSHNHDIHGHTPEEEISANGEQKRLEAGSHLPVHVVSLSQRTSAASSHRLGDVGKSCT